MSSLQEPVAESYCVIPGKLLAGKYPGARKLPELERRLGALIEAGFNAFLDLTEAGEMPAYDAYLPAGILYLRKPITDHGVPRDNAYMAEILGELARLLDSGRRLYLHCRAGIGRTGTVVACHLIEQGLAPEAALSRLNELWQGSDRSDTWPEVPETDEQRDFVRGYVAATDPTRAPEVMDAART